MSKKSSKLYHALSFVYSILTKHILHRGRKTERKANVNNARHERNQTKANKDS